ncbi:Carboxypeptidase regulatory-like domain-containing protein [Chitinophaga jiangningensis]|uniref:Carboxypeptidase regulatory-like domain-containing protein n=1 Tax=Chitinophaga jiangningensis TaxID=1419482 RepID=A0A1M7K8N7_9BACT|nr:outer membrane beta-barrel protein [Chitinophaga jiangningensis]SHM61565.1 Carboxypeptidase regulatory-like domain-containing protein [Chitinophaga jiangningensis]
MYSRIIGTLLLLAGFMLPALAQNSVIKGKVADSSLNIPLTQATVVLLQAKDSFIIASTRAATDGSFAFQQLSDTGRYVVYFSYPKYANYAHIIDMRQLPEKLADMKSVYLIPKGKLLQEVIVKSQVAAIKINGDTTEYNAGSFKVQPNASVEELLRQLPGLQVDQYGNITAHGQKVKKVLVDGEEFFSDDPTLVTRNLRADMIDKVQVYDKKSDAAAFTGIEDGIKDKTINLKIKEDKNHGIFGKAEAGAGPDGKYNLQAMVNFFKGKRRMSAYATTGTIGRTGLGSADKSKIGDDTDGDDTYNGKGLPNSTNAGFHYDKKWNKDNSSFNGNYKFSHMDIDGTEETISRNNLPTGIILSNSTGSFASSSWHHEATGKYIHKLDSNTTFTLLAGGSDYQSNNRNISARQNRRGDSSVLYNNVASSGNEYNFNKFDLNLSLEKRLKKKGRTISFYLNNNFSHDGGSGNSSSYSSFYDPAGHEDSTAQLLLAKEMHDNWRTLHFQTLFTEAFSTKFSMVINYSLDNESADDNKRSYNTAAAIPKTLDTAFSTRISSSALGNQAGLAFNFNTRKMNVKLGNNVKFFQQSIDNLYSGEHLHKHYTNLNPSARFDYKFSNYESMSMGYNGYATTPGRTQLMPFNYNNSQLTTSLPNADLHNSFTHSLDGRYQASRVVKQVYYGFNGSYNLTTSAIVQSTEVDPSGAYTYQFINMNGYTNTNYNLTTYYSKKIIPLDLQAGVGLSTNGGNTYSSINHAVNKLDYSTYSLSAELFKNKPYKYSIYLVAVGGYTKNTSSLQPESKNNYFYYTLNPSVDIHFGKKFQLHTDATFLWQQQSQAFSDNFSRLTWNAWIGRNFFKNDQLTVKVSCNDILNQNNGYDRTATNTYYSENRYTTIRRFFMLGATWNFTRFNNIKQ